MNRNRTFISNGDYSNIPSLPGVYSWFYPLRIYLDDEYEDFHNRVSFFFEYSLLDQGNGLEFTNKNTWRQWEINLKTKIIEKQSLKSKWSIIKENHHLRQVIEDCSFMFQPLYVGCAKEGLSKRIQSHLAGRTDFANRFNQTKNTFKERYPESITPYGAFEINNLYLSYIVLNNKSEVTIIEDVIQSFSNPNFSKI